MFTHVGFASPHEISGEDCSQAEAKSALRHHSYLIDFRRPRLYNGTCVVLTEGTDELAARLWKAQHESSSQ